MKDSMQDWMGSIYRRIGKGDAAAIPTESARTALRSLMRRMEGASCRGKVTGVCGETIEVYLKVREERIEDATFFTDGCHFSVICGYLATILSKGRTMDDAVEIGGDTILMVFGNIPEEETHCAYLAAEALHAAIHDWALQG
ncbi:MAG: iron-sulfur cluster assembly scaffold protein [Syntrophobacteraceae bacterium]